MTRITIVKCACNCWWTNKKSYQVFFCFCSPTWRLWRHVNNFVSRGTWKKSRLKRYSKPWPRDCAAHCSFKFHVFVYHKTVILPSILCIKRESKYRSHVIPKPKAKEWISKTLTLNIRSCYITKECQLFFSLLFWVWVSSQSYCTLRELPHYRGENVSRTK